MIRALHRREHRLDAVHERRWNDEFGGCVGTTCVFTRVVAHGTESMAGELAERRGLTLEHAHGWLKHVGLLMPIDDVDGDP